MITNTNGTITLFVYVVLDDGELGPAEQCVLVPGEPIMTMVEYQCWLTSRLLKDHPGRSSVHAH